MRSVIAVFTSIFILFALQPQFASAHIENGVLTEEFKIAEVKIRSKGPFKPGDIIAFEVLSNLQNSKMQWIQVSAECLAYPAEWHRQTESEFVNGSFAKKSFAIGVVSSGCYSGEQKIYEVILSDTENKYTRVSIEDSKLPTFVVEGGHLLIDQTDSNPKLDSLAKLKLPTQVRLELKSSQTQFLTLPRVTDGGQALDWVLNGSCGLKKIAGSSDLGGVLSFGPKGTCIMSANTPWGSNLYQAFNKAFSIEVFPSSAIKCQKAGMKGVRFSNSKKCPKGFKKVK